MSLNHIILRQIFVDEHSCPEEQSLFFPRTPAYRGGAARRPPA
jgi:hypothetical protein